MQGRTHVNVGLGFGTWDLGFAPIAEDFAPPRDFSGSRWRRQTSRFRTLRKLVRNLRFGLRHAGCPV